MLPDLSQLQALLAILREAGVTEFQQGDLRLRMGPSLAPAATIAAEPSRPAVEQAEAADELLYWSAE